MNEFPRRKQIRLKNYDYSQNGYYFITIFTKDRQPLFWKSVGADIIRPILSPCEKIVDTAINAVFKKSGGTKAPVILISLNVNHCFWFYLIFSPLKCSLVREHITPVRPIIPIRLGIAIRPFIVSDILQMRSRLPIVPTKTNAT